MQARVLDIVLEGIAAPLRLHQAEAVLPYLQEILVGWPYRCGEADPAAFPFFSIHSEPGHALLRCENHIEDTPPRRWDPVNAICDAVSALAMALPAEKASLICLHAAGVAINGQLIVFPNVRKAGKSTLSVALARAGHGVFSDDVLPLAFTADHRALGLALGIAPRLRLPLPEALGSDFRDWAAAAEGPRNQQYQYLTFAGQPAHGETLPVAAFVILDRQAEPVTARLEPVTADAAMDALLHQNFTRDRHSGDILIALAATLADRPVFRLSYADLAGAVASLEAATLAMTRPAELDAMVPVLTFRLADFSARALVAPGAGLIRQRAGTSAVLIGETLYTADAEGRAIHRMDALASAIWGLLEDPITLVEIIDLMAEAFPNTGRDQLEADLTALLDQFSRKGLVEALPGG